MFAVNGILFNHESPLRGLEFVTRKITNAIARIMLGLKEKVELGNLEAERDWGYAPEYVEAMWAMLQHEIPEDFIIATGETHSVQQFLELACNHVGLKWTDVVVQTERFKRPLDVPWLCGDASRARELLGWTAQTKFEKLVEIMVKEDTKRWRDHQQGKLFPWDAINDPGTY